MTAEEVNVAIGRRLAARRRELRLSLAQVSKRCGVTLQQIHKYETGQTGLSVYKLVQLARCLGVHPIYFLEDLPVAATAQL